MKIFRVTKDSNYTTINNTIFKDKSISCKTKGFFATIMSLPNDWDFSISGMSSILKEGKKSIYSSIKELQDFGYVKKNTVRDDKGLIVKIEYTFFETPMNKDFNPQSPERQADYQEVDNAPQLSTNIINNLNNKDINGLQEDPIDFDALLVFFNKTTGRKLRTINPKAKKGFNNIISEGYTKKDIRDAIVNCFNSEYHQEHRQYLTPEFISRMEKFEKYFDSKPKKLKLPQGYFNMKLNDEQMKLLPEDELRRYKTNMIKLEMDGGFIKQAPIEYED
jgi:uncharacterized phage protein (TIGR02220 family)